MTLLFRYLAKEIVLATLLVLTALLALFALFDLIRELGEMGKGSYNLGQILTCSAFASIPCICDLSGGRADRNDVRPIQAVHTV